MSFRLSFLSRPQSSQEKHGTLSTLEESVTAFSESLRGKDFGSSLDDLNNSRRAKLNLNKFTSMRSISGESNEFNRRTRHSFAGGTIDDLDTSGTSLFSELKPTPEVPLEETHGKEINAKKIFVREARKSRMSTFVTPTFDQDMRQLMATLQYESKRSMFSSASSVGTANSDDSKSVVKKVSFIDVTIREYPIIVGDNPAGSGGPPLTIAWEYLSSVDLDIDKYEEARAGHRRNQDKMRMKEDHRNTILRELGFSLAERKKGAKAATIVRNRRRRVNAEVEKDSTNEQLERIKRRLQSIVTLGYKNRKQKKYMRKSLPHYMADKEKWTVPKGTKYLARTGAGSVRGARALQGGASQRSLSSAVSAPQ